MADTNSSQIIQDGGRTAIIKVTTLIGAGTPPPGATVTVVDVSALAADPISKRACTGVTLEKLTFASVGVAVKLEWDATANVLLFDFPANWTEQYDFIDFGIPNNAGAGKTGDIVATSLPTAAGNTYTMILTVQKLYA
tara:strand:- start:14 stop:427 length:414 start_codon:yes stop_codon:yes gene_type:complete